MRPLMIHVCLHLSENSWMRYNKEIKYIILFEWIFKKMFLKFGERKTGVNVTVWCLSNVCPFHEKYRIFSTCIARRECLKASCSYVVDKQHNYIAINFLKAAYQHNYCLVCFVSSYLYFLLENVISLIWIRT